MSSQKFNHLFQSEERCRQYLFDLKWKGGYKCFRCGHKEFWKGRTDFHRRCRECDYDESVSANTIFHKIKIPLLKAFGMAFQIVVPKKGRSSIDLAKDFAVDQKNALAFRRKVQRAMKAGTLKEPDTTQKNEFALDSIIITHRPESLNGFQRINLSFCRHSDIHSKEKNFLSCSGKLPNPEFLSFSKLIGGKFKEFRSSLLIWNFKVWLTGVHHHCSFNYLKGYLDEFFFKYNFRKHTAQIWHTLINRMVSFKPSRPSANEAQMENRI